MCGQDKWYLVEASSGRFCRIGEWLEVGTVLGTSCFDWRPVRVEEAGRVVEVQFDVWEERLVLVVRSVSHNRGEAVNIALTLA